MAELYLGIARARLGPAAALIDPARGAIAACEENRLTRARHAATSGPPERAIDELLAYLRRQAGDITATAVVRDEDNWTGAEAAVEVDAHQAHAEYAFRAAGFDPALVVV